MAPIHALFIISDFLVYDVHIFAIILDCALLWLDFYNYMTLNKLMVFVEIASHGLISVIALSHCQRVFIDSPNFYLIVVYVIQYFVCYPIFVIYT